jgi:hypothetical protein
MSFVIGQVQKRSRLDASSRLNLPRGTPKRAVERLDFRPGLNGTCRLVRANPMRELRVIVNRVLGAVTICLRAPR